MSKLTYIRCGDYDIPNLKLSEQPETSIGKYGRMRKSYLKEHRPILYNQLLMSEKLYVQEQRFVQLVCEQTKKQKPDIVLHDSGVLVAQTIYGFDSSVMKKIEKFLREQKPELLHHQKFLENGTAERAKESGTEQNYNMIDGCVNNNPKKPRIIGNRISVLDRLHIKLEERKQKSQPQQQQQQERSRKN